MHWDVLLITVILLVFAATTDCVPPFALTYRPHNPAPWGAGLSVLSTLQAAHSFCNPYTSILIYPVFPASPSSAARTRHQQRTLLVPVPTAHPRQQRVVSLSGSGQQAAMARKGHDKQEKEHANHQQQQAQAQQQAEPQQQQRQGWQHLVAGGVAGSSAVLLLHPFDVIKTRLQVQDGLPGQLPMYKGTRDAVRTILRNEGWRGLYAGLAPSLIGSTIAWGTYLYLYEKIKSWYKDQQGIGSSGSSSGSRQQGEPATRLGAGYNLLSAAQAGAIVCVLTNPIWLVKTRLALQQRTDFAASAVAAAGSAAGKAASSSGSGIAYRGLFDAFARIGREEGLRGYYKGFGPSLVLQTAHGAIQFAAYEELKHLASRAGQPQGSPDRSLTSAEVSVYGAASKFLAAVSTYPTQVVRSRLQQRSEGRSLVYSSSWQAVAVTWQREGVAGFYKGLLPSLLRVMPQSAITLMVYEGVVKLLEQQGQGEAEGQGSLRLQLQGGKQLQQKRSITDGMSPLVIAADTQAEQ